MRLSHAAGLSSVYHHALPRNRSVDVSFTVHQLPVVLADGREILVPLLWFPRLQRATDEQREEWRLIGGGIGIHWESVDEDISVETLLSIR